MKVPICLIAIVLNVSAADRGVKPRASVAEYPASKSGDELSLGAAVLDQAQARSTFVTDIHRGYTVVEIGVFPPKESRVVISASDFVLRIAGTRTQARAASPEEIARILQKTAPAERNIDVIPTVGIGHESGRDPMTGTRRSGVYTSTGVGVGVGTTRPASTDSDRSVMQQELAEKGLPEGETAKPVSGYLYFPLPLKKKTALELEYRGLHEKLVLELK